MADSPPKPDLALPSLADMQHWTWVLGRARR